MLQKLIVLMCLVSFCPAATGAQDLAPLVNPQPAQETKQARGTTAAATQAAPQEKAPALLVAANDTQANQANQATEVERPHMTHTGLTFKEFAEVHFGEYRWLYWVGAATGLVLLHVFAFSHDH